jgi:hypothetical protein
MSVVLLALLTNRDNITTLQCKTTPYDIPMSNDTLENIRLLGRDLELLIVFIHNSLKKLFVAGGGIVDYQCESFVFYFLCCLELSFLAPHVRYLRLYLSNDNKFYRELNKYKAFWLW